MSTSEATHPGVLDGTRTEDAERERQLSRRRLLQTGAVGVGVAGAAWVAPSVVGRDGARAVGSSCGQTRTVAWNTNVPGTNNGTGSFTGWNAYQVNNMATPAAQRIRLLVDFATGGGVQRRGPGIAQLGNVSAANNFQIIKDGAPTGATAVITLRFVDPGAPTVPRSVGNLNITLLDVDKSCGSNGNFTDSVIVAATHFGTPVVPPSITFTPAYVQQSPAMTFTGIADASGTTNQGGNVNLQFTNQYITQLVLTYRSNQAQDCTSNNCTCGNPTNVNPSSDQYWGINNFTFC